MSGFGGVLADQARLGIIPSQHHDPNYPINRRVSVYGARVRRQPLDDPLHYAFGIMDDPEETYGDYQSDHLWFRKSGQRECSMWSWAASPSILASGAPRPDPTKTGVGKAGSGKVLPLYDLDTEDDRFIPRDQDTSPWASKFPGGWTGLSAKTTDEDRQVDTWHPDFLGLVDPSFGNPDNGTRVFDQTQRDQVDRDRWAYIQQIMCVLDFTHGTNPCDLSGYTLALQLGGDKLEGKPGYALYADHDNGWIGSANAEHGGPFTLGECEKHQLGFDADNNSFRPVHMDFEALWLWVGVGDGPLHFEDSKWQETKDDGPHWLHAHLRWNPNPKDHSGAQFCGNGYNGVWSWEVGTFLYVPDPPPIGDRFPPPPPPDPPPPGGGDPPPPTPPRGPITGGGGGTSTGTGVIGGGPSIEPIGEDDTLSQPLPENEPATLDEIWGDASVSAGVPGFLTPDAEFGEALDLDPYTPPHGFVDDGVGGKSTPMVGSTDYVPAYPNATQCTVFPGILFRGTATAEGEYDLSGALHVDADALDKWELSPFVGQIAGYGKSADGTWDSMEVDDLGVGKSHPTGPGGLAFLPGNTSLADLVAGTSGNANEFWLTVPQTIGSGSGRLFLGQPDPTTGKGHTGVILEATATQLNATPVNASGVEGTTTDLLSGGATPTLASVLSTGATTGGTDLVVSSGDEITVGSGAELAVSGGTITGTAGGGVVIGETGSSGTGSTLKLAQFTTAQLGTNVTGAEGMVAYNSSTGELQIHNGDDWVSPTGTTQTTTVSDGSGGTDTVNGGSTWATQLLDETVDGGGSTMQTSQLAPTGSRILNVLTKVIGEPNGTGYTSGEAYSVGVSSDTDRWGTSANSDVGTTTDSTDYNGDPEFHIDGVGFNDGTVTISASAFQYDGTSAKILVAVEYSSAAWA